jgi:hypothetical protein
VTRAIPAVGQHSPHSKTLLQPVCKQAAVVHALQQPLPKKTSIGDYVYKLLVVRLADRLTGSWVDTLAPRKLAATVCSGNIVRGGRTRTPTRRRRSSPRIVLAAVESESCVVFDSCSDRVTCKKAG